MEIFERKGVVKDLFEKLVSPAPKPYKAKIGLVGIGFEEHFDWASIKVNYKIAQDTLKGVMPEDKFELIVSPEPLQSKEEILSWLVEMKHADIDGIIIYQASYIAGDLAAVCGRWFMENPIPLLSWSHDEAVGGRLSNNRLCGQNFFLNIMHSSHVKYSWLFESPESPSLAEHLMVFAKACYGKASLNQSAVLMVGGFRVPGFYDCEMNEMAILRHLGLRIDRIDMETMWRYSQKFKDVDIANIKKALLTHKRCKFCNVPDDQIMNSLRLSLGMTDYARCNGYLGIGLKNWPELFDNYGFAGDGAGSLVQDMGIPVADESDMGALLTMVIFNQLTLGESVPSLFDMSLVNDKEDYLGFWHCGGASSRLLREGRKYEVRKHSILENKSTEDSVGFMMEFLHETGPVTIAKGQYPNLDNMFSWEGEVVESEMAFRGSYAQIKPNDIKADEVVSTILNNGLDHHWIVARGHVMNELHELNHFLGIKNIEVDKGNKYFHGLSK